MEGAHTGVAGTVAGPRPLPGPRLSSRAILLMVMKEGLHGAVQLLAKCLLLGAQVARRLAAWGVAAGAQVPGVIGSGIRYLLSTRAGKWAVGLAVGLAFVRLSLVRRGTHGVVTQLNSELSLLFGMLRLQGSLTLKLGPPHFGGGTALHGGDSPGQPQGVDELRISCPQGLKEHIVRFLESQSARKNGDFPAFQLSPHRTAHPHTHAHAAASRPHALAAADDSAHHPSLHHHHQGQHPYLHHTATLKPGASCTGLDSPAPTPANWVFQPPFSTDHLDAIPAAITALGLSAQGDSDPTSILSPPAGVEAALPAAPVLLPLALEPLGHAAMSAVGKPAWSVENANGGGGGVAEAVAVAVPAAGGAVGAVDLGPIAAAVAGTAAAATVCPIAAVFPSGAGADGGMGDGAAKGVAEALGLHGSYLGKQQQAAAGGVQGRSMAAGAVQATEAPNTEDAEASGAEQQERGQQQQQVPGARTAAPVLASTASTTTISASHAPPRGPILPSTANGGIVLDQSSRPIAIGSTTAVSAATAATATSAPVTGTRQQPSRPLAAGPRTQQQQQPYPHAHNYHKSPSHSSTFHSPAFLATLGPSYADEGPLDDRDELRSLLAHAATYKPSVAGSSPRAKPLAHSSTSAAAAGGDAAAVAAQGNGVAPGSPQGGSAAAARAGAAAATVLVKTPRWGKASSMVGNGASSGAKRGAAAARGGAGAGAGGGDSGRIKSPESILGLREIGLEGWNATSRHWERTHSDE